MSNLCAKGCGFFGHPSTQNLCSQCYKQSISRTSSNITLPAAATHNSSTGKERCKFCGKKIGLLGFQCRCGHSFCGIHRHPETHLCPYDFRNPGRSTISHQNPTVKADKHPDRL